MTRRVPTGRTTRMKTLRSAGLLLVWAGLIFGAGQSRAQSEPRQWANEYELKAALVFRLMSFVEWPGEALGDHVTVGFAGEGPMGAALVKSFQGKRIGSRPIEVREVRNGADLRGCNVLVVAFSDASRTRQALSQLKNASVLTIGDGEGFGRMGGVIALVPRENTFHVAINVEAAERAHIQISSKLLTMAKRLTSEEER
jgi:hypothetical protein